MPDVLLMLVIFLLVASLWAVMTRNRGGEVDEEDQTLNTRGKD